MNIFDSFLNLKAQKNDHPIGPMCTFTVGNDCCKIPVKPIGQQLIMLEHKKKKEIILL